MDGYQAGSQYGRNGRERRKPFSPRRSSEVEEITTNLRLQLEEEEEKEGCEGERRREAEVGEGGCKGNGDDWGEGKKMRRFREVRAPSVVRWQLLDICLPVTSEKCVCTRKWGRRRGYVG